MLSHRRFQRSVLVSLSAVALFIAGCSKKPVATAPPVTPPPPPAAKPTASISADHTAISKGDSVKLTWATTDATSVAIAPEVGAVTAQGSTAVTPADSTTYTLTASGAGGSTDATVRVTVNAPAAVVEQPKTDTLEQMFLKEVRDAYFDYDSAEIKSESQEALRKTADFLKNYPQLRVTIEGHCDERGSTEYNLALGDRRASAVKQYIISLGIPADRFNTVSYGKEKPFCMEASEACYTQNRRGHFVQAR